MSGTGSNSAELNTALVHLYRAEVSRANVWRSRLDTTTNWAVVTTGAALTFAFSSIDNPPVVLLINTLLVLLFLVIETRRYRYYELWMFRVRLLEHNYFAGLLNPLSANDVVSWGNKLTDSFFHPRFPISLLEAFGRRYRRNYIFIFALLSASWLLKIYMHPTDARNVAQFLERAAIGSIDGRFVLLFGVFFQGTLLGLGLLSVRLRTASDSLENEGGIGLGRMLREASREAFDVDLHLPQLDSRKRLVFIISDSAESIGQELLTELKRGVTLLEGTGLYTNKQHGVLMCILEARQTNTLRQTVRRIDPSAFVVINPVHDVHGHGFRPLEA